MTDFKFDLQTIGRKLAYLRRRNLELEQEVKDLKQTIEDILLSPGSFEYYSGIAHPLNDGPTDNKVK
jgi:cell division protein FtsB